MQEASFQLSFFPHDTNVVTLTKCNVMVLQHNDGITFICNVIYMLLIQKNTMVSLL